jgi:alpha-L-fucosidase 2
MASRHTIALTRPATGFTGGFPLGNGWLGAVVRGLPDHERIDLNIDTLWSGGPGRGVRSSPRSDLVEELRAATQRGAHVEADRIARQLQGVGWTEAYQPLGQLRWAVAPETDAASRSAYERSLDLSEAVARCRSAGPGGAVATTSFVSAPAGVLVHEAEGAVHRGLPEPQLLVPHVGARLSTWTTGGVLWTVATGRAPARTLPDYVDAADPVVYATDEPDADGLVDAGMGFVVVAAVQRTSSRSLRLLVSAATGYRGWDQRPSADVEALSTVARGRVEEALARPTSDLLAEHVDDYRAFFDRTDLDLTGKAAPTEQGLEPVEASPAGRAELLFHLGKYLLISSSRPGSQAANLQGIWNVDARPAWSCNYTTNINLQMNYWPTHPLGLTPLHDPLTGLTCELIDAGGQIASAIYAAEGSVTHHNTDLWRFSLPVSGDVQWANWTMAQAWLLASLWEQWTHSGDETFARDVALPAHATVTDFILSTLVDDGENRLRVSPSTSPEHRFVMRSGEVAAVSAGSTVDQELAHEVLSHYVALSRLATVDRESHSARSSRASEALRRLRLPGIAVDGTLMEWSSDVQGSEPGHRHLSHLYGLHPGRRISESGTPAEFAGAAASLRQRLSHGSGYTSWSQAWVLCLGARLRDSGLVQRAVDNFVESLSSPSLLGIHPHGAWSEGFVFQIDGNLGAVAGLAEAYVQDREGVVVLLAAPLPGASDGHLEGVHCPGRRVVDVYWNEGRFTMARLRVARDGDVTVEIPEYVAGAGVCLDHDGRTIEAQCTEGVGGRLQLTWSARAGASYQVAVPAGSDSQAKETLSHQPAVTAGLRA